MTGAAIVLVLISAVAHATWNLLAKRATRPEVFTWWMTAAGSTIFLPVAIYYFVTDPPNAAGWGYIAATVALHTAYFFSLGRAYKHSDLSLVYPIARGLGIALIPILGVSVIGETVSWPAAVGAALIVGGVLSVGLSGGSTGGSMQLAAKGPERRRRPIRGGDRLDNRRVLDHRQAGRPARSAAALHVLPFDRRRTGNARPDLAKLHSR